MSADDDRAAFVAWIRDDGYLVPDAVTPIEWDDEGLPVYYTLHDGERRYLDGEWHGWQAAIAAEREAAAKVCDERAAKCHDIAQRWEKQYDGKDESPLAEANQWYIRKAEAESNAAALTEAEREELARVLRDAKDAWVHSPYPVSESMYLADAAAAWFAKRGGAK